MEIKVMKRVMQANIDKAKKIRKLLYDKNVLMINLIGSPGSGKTLTLENTLEILKNRYNMAIIEGDVASNKDALRLQRFDTPIVLINTDGSCHLDSATVEKALTEFDLDNLDLIFVENVGNLVCPAEFDIGEDLKVAVSSVTEGDDKPEKYPLLFREADLIILNKIDLIPYTNFDKKEYGKSVERLNGLLQIYELSGVTKVGTDKWVEWIDKKIQEKRENCG